jgi:16S rRNA (cytosine1402-N4)-methyltransferase
MKSIHKPVLLSEVVEFLGLKKLAHLKTQAKFIDATVGGGGHSYEIVKNGGYVLGIDDDEEILEVARKRLEACPTMNQAVHGRFTLVSGNFRDIDKVAKDKGFDKVQGIIFDLGLSSFHFDSASRGFSFKNPSALLDMRLNRHIQEVTAAKLLNSLSRKNLEKLFSRILDFKEARILSKNIILSRSEKEIKTIGDFLEIIKRSIKRGSKKGLHYATLPMLALRIAVNSELDNLKEALPKAFKLLKPNGKLVVISFHSGEDTLVKDYFKRQSFKGSAKVITKKPILSKTKEVKDNPRARSAKMRVLERR